MINKQRLINTFCDLVKIDSPSGEEDEIASFLSKKLTELGFNIFTDNYGNIIAKQGEGNTLMLSAHMDTVEPGRNIQPIVDKDLIKSKEKTILGGDCKAGIAAILEGVESAFESNKEKRNLEIVITRDEEPGLLGAKNLDYSLINSKESLVFDGNGPVNTVTGISPTYIKFDITITGIGAHAGVEPEKGLSAIKIATELINELPQGRLDEETTFNVGIISGGTVRNAVPVEASINGEFRSQNTETLDLLYLQLDNSINSFQKKYDKSKIDLKTEVMFEMYKLNENSNIVKSVFKSLETLDLIPDIKPSGGGTDANIMLSHGIDCIVVGMATNEMHTVDEYVVIPDLVDAAKLCELQITNNE